MFVVEVVMAMGRMKASELVTVVPFGLINLYVIYITI